MYQFVYRDVEMYVVLDLMKFDLNNVDMYICCVLPYLSFSKSMFLMDHNENQILDKYVD